MWHTSIQETALAWLYNIPTMQLAGLFALLFVGVTWLGIIFIHPLFRKLLRGQAELNNLVGVALASHCAFFGLLLGLLAVAAYQNLSDIDKSATKEAEYLHAIYRSVAAYPEPMRSKALPLIREYTPTSSKRLGLSSAAGAFRKRTRSG